MFDYKLVISENDNFIDFKILENNKNDKNFIFIVNEGTGSTEEIIIKLCKEFCSTRIVGKNTYGKNIICKNEVVNNLFLMIPYKKASINGNTFTNIQPDQFISNINDYTFRQLEKLELGL